MRPAEQTAFALLGVLALLLWLGRLFLPIPLWLPIALTGGSALLLMARIVLFAVRQD